MANYKIIGGDGKEYGPISGEQLRQWISEGRLGAQSLVQAEGGSGWQPLSVFPEFELQTPVYPSTPERPPVSIKVFGIINIVFGSLGLLCMPFALVMMSFAAKQPGYHPPEMSPAWTKISMVLGLIGSGIALASGIGLCRLKSWARKLAVYYAWFSIAFSVIGIAMNWRSMNDSSIPEQARVIATVTSIGATLFSWTYNGLLIYFLTRPAAKRSMGEPE